MTRREFIQLFAEAIATMEGFFKPGTFAAKHNNPGNLRSWGKYPVVNGYVMFPNAQTGWDALRSQITKNIGRGLTTYEFFAGQRDDAGNVIPGGYPGYSPSQDKNNPLGYGQYVAGRLKILPGVPLNTITTA